MNNINVNSEIIEYSGHQFLYGKNSSDRVKFLKKAVQNYPIKFNESIPTPIYIDDIGLPQVETKSNNLDQVKINRLGMTYLEFTIAYNIIKRISEENPESQIDFEKLINSMKIMINEGSKEKINTLGEFRDALRSSINFYKQYYEDYLSSGETNLSIEDLEVPFLMNLELFIRRLQKSTQNDSFYSVILDKQKDIALPSVKAINGLLNSRCNSLLSIKVACEPGEWKTYRDFSGSVIESMHDYSVVELDDSFRKHIEKIKKSYNLGFDEI